MGEEYKRRTGIIISLYMDPAVHPPSFSAQALLMMRTLEEGESDRDFAINHPGTSLKGSKGTEITTQPVSFSFLVLCLSCQAVLEKELILSTDSAVFSSYPCELSAEPWLTMVE
jgi:hypothetical protein